jgi:phosphopantothenoylcysteine decarboxylase/phosphopantothenate--cysteine ligase
MLKAVQNALPVHIAVCAAAVADWSPAETQNHKIKKRSDETPLTITLKENPDILKTISNHKNRPDLVIGFAAETENLEENARTKLTRKNCDWILANNVAENVFGKDRNHVYLVTSSEVQDWQPMSKTSIAVKLTEEITKHMKDKK